MASVINAVRNIISDSWWLLKIIVFALPIFLILNYKLLDEANQINNIIIFIIISCLYLGISSFIINRNINNLSPILPSLFSVFDLLKRSIFVSLVSIPLYMLLLYAFNYLYTTLNSQQIVMYIIMVIVTFLFSPFILIPTVYYSVRDNLLDALNIKLILNASGNFTVAFMSYLIQYVIIFGLIGFCIYKLLTQMIESEMALNIAISIFIVLSIFTLYSYCSDLYPEVIPEVKNKVKKKKLKR